MKTIINKTVEVRSCGGKKGGGCCVEYEMPYGLMPKRISDNVPKPQIQAGTKGKPKIKREKESE